MIAVIDIDGVLADAGHRQHFVDGRPKDWARFFAAVGADAPIPAGIAMAQDLAADHEIVLLSGRPESTRDETTAWLAANDVRFDRLVLRADADYRKAADLKAELIATIGSPAEIAVVVDDDRSITDRLGSDGYRTHLFG